MSALVARFDALRSIAFGSITGSYLPIGTPFQHLVRIIKITNTTNTDMFISFDGTTDNDYVPAGGFVLYDITTNGYTGTEFVQQLFTQIYVKYNTAPASGSVFVTGVFGRGE